MSLDSMFAVASDGVAASLAFSAVVPVVPGIARAADMVERLGPQSAASAEGRAQVGAWPWVELHEQSGVVQILDPRLFQPGRGAFCLALAQAAIETFQARRVEISLQSSICRLELKPGAFDRGELARRVAAAVSAATPMIGDRARAPGHSGGRDPEHGRVDHQVLQREMAASQDHISITCGEGTGSEHLAAGRKRRTGIRLVRVRAAPGPGPGTVPPFRRSPAPRVRGCRPRSRS